MFQGKLKEKLKVGIIPAISSAKLNAHMFTKEVGVHLMTKVPFPGKVKTRLIPELGIAGATEAYWKMLSWVLPRIHDPESWNLQVWFANLSYLKVGPFGQDIERRIQGLFEPFSTNYAVQPNGNLGHRLNEVLKKSKNRCVKSIVLGGDSVSIDQSLIKRAVNALDVSDVIVSPTEDGGFCLLGAKKPIRGLDKHIQWGSSSVHKDLISLCKDEGLSVTQLDKGFDVDTYPDWLRFLKIVDEQKQPESSI